MGQAQMQMDPNVRVLRETCARFFSTELPVVDVRRLAENDEPVLETYLQRTADLGIYGFLVPEEHGGGSVSGSGVLDAAMISELRGRHIQPGPFIGTHVVADALARHGTPEMKAEVLPRFASGEAFGCWAYGSLGKRGELQGRAEGDSVIIDGLAPLVRDAGESTYFLVSVRVEGALRQFLLNRDSPGLHVNRLKSLDLTDSACEVRLVAVRVPKDRELKSGDAFEQQLALAALLVAADSVGVMESYLDITVEYAKKRMAFGRPIGSFQAIKHLLADQLMRCKAGKAAVAAATEALVLGHNDGPEVASIAKAFVSDCSFEVAQGCFQVHGGLGYAWECDQHLYLRRLAGNSEVFGDARIHREMIAEKHGLVSDGSRS